MSIGLSHSNMNFGFVGLADPQSSALLILNTRFCESSFSSRRVSCVNSPRMTDSS